jgi:phosphoenolpyruvate synthase/pyruvate phosphate dikinase
MPKQAGRAVVLVRKETTAEDIVGMKSAKGILTEQVKAPTRYPPCLHT